MDRSVFWNKGLRYGPIGFSLIVAILSLVAALQFSLPHEMPVLLPFSESLFAHTEDQAKPDKRVLSAKKTVAAAPGRAENWLLLASAYQARDQDLSPLVIGSLRTSYRAAPYSPDAHDWRLEYVFSNWTLLPQDLRTAAMKEADAYIKRYAGRIYLKHLVTTLPDKDGRIALGLILLTRDRTDESTRRVEEYKSKLAVELTGQ
jgi:hypothetical protein